MDFERSFSYVFEDNEWISKLGLGAIISLVPILNFAWSGYMVDILRNVMNDEREPLPTWDDLGRNFTEGLILFAAGLVYALPALILFFLPLSMTAFSSILSGNGDLQDLGRAIGQAGGALFFCLFCVLALYGLAFSIFYPAILVMFSRQRTFASCFNLRGAFDLISRNAAAFFTAWGLSLLAGLGVGLLVGLVNMVVGWVPCLGWIIGLALSLGSGVYISAVYAHLFGQFGKAAFGENRLAAVI